MHVRRGPVYHKRSLPEYLNKTRQGKRSKRKTNSSVKLTRKWMRELWLNIEKRNWEQREIQIIDKWKCGTMSVRSLDNKWDAETILHLNLYCLLLNSNKLSNSVLTTLSLWCCMILRGGVFRKCWTNIFCVLEVFYSRAAGRLRYGPTERPSKSELTTRGVVGRKNLSRGLLDRRIRSNEQKLRMKTVR